MIRIIMILCLLLIGCRNQPKICFELIEKDGQFDRIEIPCSQGGYWDYF